MSTVDNVWDNAKAVFGMAEKKTKQAVEISKKKIKEKKLEDKIDGLYKTLGKMYYVSAKKDAAVNECDVKKIVDSIDEAKSQLKELRAEINSIRYDKVCPVCNAGVKKDDDFCRKCGAELK
ncbi:MAG: zinc ribbon domain-containing protein [Clostridia bacterium]|nr:zinc ribbon domain-containing protein [Clostridia bacterium]